MREKVMINMREGEKRTVVVHNVDPDLDLADVKAADARSLSTLNLGRKADARHGAREAAGEQSATLGLEKAPLPMLVAL